MSIRFKCEHCQKPLSVKDNLAGKRAACPACKKPILIPAPTAAPADIEAFAASALADPASEAPPPEPAAEITTTCVWCDEEVKFAAELGGKQAPCPACKRIVKVPALKVEKKKDWREINRNGPAAARMNLPEQLDGAWGTEAKSRVAHGTLVEAGAIEEAPARPIGIGGWIRRVTISLIAIAVVAGLAVAISRSRIRTVHKNVIEEARKIVDERNKDADPKKKVSPVLRAEIERAAGELKLSEDKGEEARQRFMAARGHIGATPKEALVDHDFFLLDLARSQLEMHGTEDQVRTKARLDWEENKASASLFKEIMQTAQSIKSPDATAIVIRELATELINRKQVSLAISLASQLSPMQADGGRISPAQVQFVALVLAHGDPKKLDNKLIPPPDPKAPLERATRLAYAEGHARKGDHKVALDLVKNKDGAALDRLEAAIGVASVILSDRNNKEVVAQAAPFIVEAMEVKKGFKKGVPPWLTFQLCRLGVQAPEHAAAARELIGDLPASFKGRAQLEWLMAKAVRGDTIDAAKDLPDADGPSRAQAWSVVARHATAAGRPVSAHDAEADDNVCRAFANIGVALAGAGPKR